MKSINLTSHDKGKGNEDIFLVQVYTCTSVFLTKEGRNAHDNYHPHFCSWSHGRSWYWWLPSSTTHSVFPLPSASTSSGHGTYLVVTQTFIAERSRSLVVLSELSCSFPLTLITGHGNTKRSPKESHIFPTYFSLPPFGGSPVSTW